VAELAYLTRALDLYLFSHSPPSDRVTAPSR
jgi:hypothetical protein